MGTLYENIIYLCTQRGIKGGKMCADLGISKGLLTDLKAGRKKGMSATTADKIASYFGVSVGYLLGTEAENAPTLNERDRRDIAKDLEKIMGDLEHSDDLMFDGVPLSPESIESLRSAMKLGLEAVKLRNKETFTPKKYKK